MKPLLLIKWADVTVQLLALLVTPAIMIHDGGFMAGWIALGAAQVLSCAANLIGLKKQYRARSRRGYELIIGVFLAACIPFEYFRFDIPVDLITDIIEGIVIATVVASPALAIWYFTITIAEMFKIHNDEDATHPEAN